MRFGEVPVDSAEGAILVHSTRAGKKRLKKGRLLSADDLTALRSAGVESVTVVQLEAEDIHEDTAATRVAAACQGPGLTQSAPFTGRVNLVADADGVAVIDPQALDALNLIDEALTIATVPPFDTVRAGQMVATIKIIPFSAPVDKVAACEKIAQSAAPLVQVKPFAPKRVGFIQTQLPDTKAGVLDKTTLVMKNRLDQVGADLLPEQRVDHATAPLAAAITEVAADAELIFVAGASAITDRRDVIPAAIEQAGGTVDHFGMPVDPGNLLLFGTLNGKPVVGMPGCARSPKLNGFDWVLQRLAADIPVTKRDIMLMGAGGLLKEIETRPQPRGGDAASKPAAAPAFAPRIAAILLAAGRSTRMGTRNKLLIPVDGKPMVRHVAEQIDASKAIATTVVVGHEADKIKEALDDLPLTFTENPDYATGLASSVRAGLTVLPEDCDGFLVCLGDMPTVAAADVDRLIAAFNPTEGRAICIPVHRGKRGNPVLFARRFAIDMADLEGDIGARRLIGAYEDLVCEVETEAGVLTDIDTPAALDSFNARSPR